MKLNLSTLNRGLLSLTGAALIGLASAGFTASAVGAQPNNTNDGLNCFSYGPHDITGIYAPGTIVTVTDEDGKTRKYRCNGETGQWEEVARPSPVSGLNIFTGAQVSRIR